MISSIGNNNIELLLQSYRQIQERPIRELESRRSKIDDRISIFNDLKSKLNALDSLITELKQSGATSIFGSKAVTSSDETILTVTASSSAVATSHTITVNQLAKADQVVSNQYTLSNTTIADSLGAGTYTFDVTVNGTTTQVSVSISAGDDNETVLKNIVTAVNNTTNVGIKASFIKDGETTGRLVFTSENTGSSFEMTLSDSTGSLLSTIGMNDSVAMSGTSGGYIYTSDQLDAKLTIDGISVVRNSNTIDDAIEGLTLTLHKVSASGSAPVTVNVTNDTSKIKDKLQSFIDAYNEVIDFIKTNTSVNTETHERSILSGDFSVINLRLQLREALSSPVTGLTAGDPTILADIGITPDRDGKLSISDAKKLDDMLEQHLDQVAALFNSTDGFAPRLESVLDEMTGAEGILQKRQDVLERQVELINNRIDQLRKQVDKRLDFFRDQFSQLQAAMIQFTNQSRFLSALTGSGFIQF